MPNGDGLPGMLPERRSRETVWPMLFATLLVAVLLQHFPQADALGAVASHHDHTGILMVSVNSWHSYTLKKCKHLTRSSFAEHYLRLPVHVITMTTNDTEYENGLRMFEISFNRTRNIDTPMDMEVIQTTKDKFWELGWRSKLLYVLKSLRCDRCLQQLSPCAVSSSVFLCMPQLRAAIDLAYLRNTYLTCHGDEWAFGTTGESLTTNW